MNENSLPIVFANEHNRIGKLTIDIDHVLGNGSGGTFVFEGKWNVSLRSPSGYA